MELVTTTSAGQTVEMGEHCSWREQFSTGNAWTGFRLVEGSSAPGELPEGHCTAHLLALKTSPLRYSYRLAGDGWRSVKLVPNDIVLIPSALPVAENWADPFGSLVVMVEPHLLRTSLGGDVPQDMLELRHGCLKPDPLISELTAALRRDFLEGLPKGRLYGESLGTALAAHLVRAYGTQEFVAGAFRGGLSARHLRLVIDYINDHLERDLSLRELSALTGLSASHFGRAFKQSVGAAPHRYVLLRRVSRARLLLRTTKLAIPEIALRCGFATQSAFTTAFGRMQGITPGACRRAFA